MTREELVSVAMQTWEQAVIEEALGEDAARVLPEAIRLVELRARVPRYQRDMLRDLARREGTSVDAVLARELCGCGFRACRGVDGGTWTVDGDAVAGDLVTAEAFRRA
jgi:hypothetical protein